MWDLSWQGTDSLVVVHRLQSVLTSVLVACRLGFSMACRVLVLWLAVKLTYPALQGVFLTSGPPGESPLLYYVNKILALLNSMLVSFTYIYVCGCISFIFISVHLRMHINSIFC